MSGHGGAHRAGPALAWLTHPATVVSLVVLLVNDHWLKSAAPGPVTGKLSDFAGVVLLPPVLAALIPRLPAGVAIAVTGVGFTVTKATVGGAEAASALWSVLRGPSIVRADVTDLVALPALLIAWWAWTRARERPLPPRVFARAVLLPVALLGVVATSPPQYPSVSAVAEHDGRLVLARGDTGGWLVSADAGRSWEPIDDDRPPFGGRPEDCVDADPFVCYRIVPDRLAAEESVDGGATWRMAWEVSEPARRVLAADMYPDVRDVRAEMSSRSLVVWPDGAGHTVLVANGRDGYARRDVDGTWRRVAFEPYSDRLVVGPGAVSAERTVPARFADLPPVFLACLLAGVLVVLVAAYVAAARIRQRKLLIPAGMASAFGVFVALPTAVPDNDFAFFFVVVAAIVLGLAWFLALGLPVAGGARGNWSAHAAVLSALVIGLTALPFVAWGLGLLTPIWLAAAIAGSAFVAGLGHAYSSSAALSGRPSKSTDEYAASFSRR